MIMLTTVETRALEMAAKTFRRSPGMQAEQFVVDALAPYMDAAVEAQRVEDGGVITGRYDLEGTHDNPTYHAPVGYPEGAQGEPFRGMRRDDRSDAEVSAEADGPAGAALPPE